MSTDWRARAACRDVDPESFFPTASSGPLWAAQVEAAKKVCASCPVLEQCRRFALDGLECGVAGGLTEQERRATRRCRLPGGRRGSRAKRLDYVRGQREDGRRMLAEGRRPRAVAALCGVSERTTMRWAAALRLELPARDGASS